MKHHRKTYLAVLLLLLALLASCGGKRMRQRLQFVAECNRADTVFTERWQPTVDSLADYFRSHGTRNERMTALYLKGRVHHDLGEAPQALDAYQRATEQADTTQKNCDLHTLVAVYGQMANLFHAQYLPDSEMEALKMAERIAWKDKKTYDALVAFHLRSRPYYLKGEKDSVMFVEKQAREFYLKYGYREEAAQATLGTISILLDRQEYAEAGRYIRMLEQESGWFDANGNILKGKELCYYDKGRYLLAVGKTDSALLYFNRTLAGHKETGYKGLLSVYEKKNNPDSIAKYAKLFAAANDSNFLHVNQEKVHQITAMYDYSHHQQMAKQKEQEAKDWKNGLVFVSLAAVIILALSMMYFFRSKAKKLAEIYRLNSIKDELENLLTQKDKLTEENRQEIIRLHNKNSRIHRSMKEETERLQHQIETLRKQLFEKASAQTRQNMDSTKIIENFKEKYGEYTHGYTPPTEKEWSRLEEAFSCEHSVFFHFIASNRGMKRHHVWICMMMKLNIAERMMALALGTDSKRIDRLKRQANKTLFGESSAKTLRENLQAYF
ncbi:MAG: hypothetical protein II934_00750 [Prevotella sp.]|nr:hypothetical protein [Prevotella sp.]